MLYLFLRHHFKVMYDTLPPDVQQGYQLARADPGRHKQEKINAIVNTIIPKSMAKDYKATKTRHKTEATE